MANELALELRSREGDFAKRKNRLAMLKKGPGVFVYDGEAHDTEWIPTPRRTTGKDAVLDERGLPVLDSDGNQVFDRPGKIMRDIEGRVVLGGPPKRELKKIEVYALRGVEFPAGKPVRVDNSSLALKLRGMLHFEEVDGEAAESTEAEAPKKRGPGRPKKPKSEEGSAEE